MVLPVQTGTANLGAVGTSLSISLPAAAVSGHLLTSSISIDKSVTGLTVSTGWAIAEDYLAPSVSVAIAYRTADGTATDNTVTWSWTTARGAAADITEHDNAVPLALVRAVIAGDEAADLAITSLSGSITTHATKATYVISTTGVDTNTAYAAGEPVWDNMTAYLRYNGGAAGGTQVSSAHADVAANTNFTTVSSWTAGSDQVGMVLAAFADQKPKTADWTDPLDSAKDGTWTAGVYENGYLKLDSDPDYKQYNNINTGTRYEFHDSELVVEFETEHWNNGESGYEWWMELTQRKADETGDNGNRIMLVIHGNKGRYVAVKQPTGDLAITNQYQSYDPIADRFLRIREAAGTIYWDTSPDKVTWTNRNSVASPAWVAEGRFYVRLYAGCWRNFTIARPGYFNNINLPHNGVGANNQLPWRTSTFFSKFVEAFDAALSSTVWEQWGTTVSGGILDIPVHANYYYAKTKIRYQAKGSIIGIETPQYPNPADGTTQAYFEILTAKDTGFRFLWQNNILYFREVNANALVGTEASVTTNTTDFKYLRFRESAGTMYWETSATGSEGSWVTRHSQAWTINPDDLYLVLSSGTWGTPVDPGSFKIAGINIYPVPVGTDFLSIYNLQALINQNFSALYDIFGTTGLSHGTVYNVNIAINSDILLAYTLYQSILKDSSLLWDVSAAVGQPVEVVYDVLVKLATAANDISLSYNTNAVVASDGTVPYDVLIGLSKELSSLWNVTILAGQQTEILWAIRKAIAGDTYLRWQFEIFWYRLVEEAITWTQQNTPSDVWTPQNPKGKLWTPSI